MRVCVFLCLHACVLLSTVITFLFIQKGACSWTGAMHECQKGESMMSPTSALMCNRFNCAFVSVRPQYVHDKTAVCVSYCSTVTDGETVLGLPFIQMWILHCDFAQLEKKKEGRGGVQSKHEVIWETQNQSEVTSKGRGYLRTKNDKKNTFQPVSSAGLHLHSDHQQCSNHRGPLRRKLVSIHFSSAKQVGFTVSERLPSYVFFVKIRWR